MATSDKLWNGFKDSLLWSLHRKTAHQLSGSKEFLRAEAAERAELLEEVMEDLPKEFTAEEVTAHFHALPPRYFLAHGVRDIVEDVELAHKFLERQLDDGAEPLVPSIRWRHQRDLGCTEVRICTWDRAGLFGSIAGTLSAVGLNILSAQIFTRSDGIALDVFSVTDGRSGSLAEQDQMEKFDRLLGRVLKGDEVDLDALIAKQTRSRTLYEAYTGEQIPTQVILDNDSLANRSLIEVEAEDRIGLLYTVSQELAELGVNISAARILTEKGGAIDTFYVTGPSGGKINVTALWPKVESQLRKAIDRLGK